MQSTAAGAVEFPRFISITKTAQILGVSKPFCFQHIVPAVKTVKVGRRRLVDYADLLRWIEANTEGGAVEEPEPRRGRGRPRRTQA